MFELSNRGMFDRGEHSCRHDPIYNGRAKCGFGFLGLFLRNREECRQIEAVKVRDDRSE
jgi:hypothetical protein